jgi:hypothetical protein
MKLRVHKNKKTGETFVEYGDGHNIGKYRYKLLKKIIESVPGATIIVDSNQKTAAGSLRELEDFLKRSGIKYSAFPVKQNNAKFFGLEIKKKNVYQKMIVMETSSGQFSSELYETYLKQYDIAIGIGRLRTFEEICDMLKIDLSRVLFNTEFFEESIYDSAVCGSLRSSKDIKPYVEAATNETAF